MRRASISSPNSGLTAAFDVTGPPGTTSFTARAGSDNLSGLGGNDDLMGNGGDDILTGGAGTGDTAIYAGARSGYTYSYTTDGSGRATAFTGVDDTNPVGGDEGTDTLSGVEVLQFLGQALNVDDPVQLFDASNTLVGTFDVDPGGDRRLAAPAIRSGSRPESIRRTSTSTPRSRCSARMRAKRSAAAPSNAAGETTIVGRRHHRGDRRVTLDGLRFVNNGSTTGGAGRPDPPHPHRRRPCRHQFGLLFGSPGRQCRRPRDLDAGDRRRPDHDQRQ